MLIINGKILTMAGKVWEKGYVRTKGNKIIETGDMELLTWTQGEEIIDAEGGWVMPGLIDAHAHIGITEERKGAIGEDSNETTDPVTPHLRGLDAINPMDCAFHDAIMAGITSVMAGPGSSNVVGGQFVFMKTHGRCVDEMVVLEPAAMKVAFGENPKTNYGDQGQSPATRMAIAALLREELFRARQYQERKQKGALEELDFRMEAWLPVLEKKIPMKAHVHRADDILTAIRLAREFDVDLTLDHCTEGHLVAREVASSGFPAIVGTDLTSRSKVEVENMSFKTCGDLERAGVLVAVTTDHPVTILRYLALCAGLAVRQGMSLEGGLKALTINPAKICRVDHRVGSLEKGKDADIAVFTGNPMEIFTKTICTMIDGEVVYRREEEQ